MQSINGWILPANIQRAIQLGFQSPIQSEIITTFRFIKFYFISDNSVNRRGWDITLSPNTPYPYGADPIAEGTTLYLENSYPAQRLTSDNVNQVVFGFNACSNTDNDSVLIRVAPPRN